MQAACGLGVRVVGRRRAVHPGPEVIGRDRAAEPVAVGLVATEREQVLAHRGIGEGSGAAIGNGWISAGGATF